MKNGTCLAPKCNEEAHARGLCKVHYQSAVHLIRNKRMTWRQMIRKGWAEKPKPRGRKPKTVWGEV